ncbi:MAG: FAD-dependent oxidoreductase [Vicinamibacterales bacterium]
MTRVAVIGGGPGGLMTARRLERRSGGACRITIIEADARLGGKAHTRRFDTASVPYESGIAECYDYSAFGRDPLRELVAELGLRPIHTHGTSVVLDGTLLRDDEDLGRHFGQRTVAAIRACRAAAAALLPARTCATASRPPTTRIRGRRGRDRTSSTPCRTRSRAATCTRPSMRTWPPSRTGSTAWSRSGTC